jgi:hypothetical protein
MIDSHKQNNSHLSMLPMLPVDNSLSSIEFIDEHMGDIIENDTFIIKLEKLNNKICELHVNNNHKIDIITDNVLDINKQLKRTIDVSAKMDNIINSVSMQTKHITNIWNKIKIITQLIENNKSYAENIIIKNTKDIKNLFVQNREMYIKLETCIINILQDQEHKYTKLLNKIIIIEQQMQKDVQNNHDLLFCGVTKHRNWFHNNK